MIFIINVCNQSRAVVGYVEHHTDANQVYVAPRLFNVWEVLPVGRLGYFVPRLQRCFPLGVLSDGIPYPLLGNNPHRHIFTDCKPPVKVIFTRCQVYDVGYRPYLYQIEYNIANCQRTEPCQVSGISDAHFPIYNLRHVFCTRSSAVASDAVVQRVKRHASPETRDKTPLSILSIGDGEPSA